MQKPILLVPAKFALEMLPNADTDQKLASGSYYIAIRPKKPTDVTKRQRQFRNRRLDAGYRRFEVLLPASVYELLHLLRRDGETMAALIARLASGNNDLISICEPDN